MTHNILSCKATNENANQNVLQSMQRCWKDRD